MRLSHVTRDFIEIVKTLLKTFAQAAVALELPSRNKTQMPKWWRWWIGNGDDVYANGNRVVKPDFDSDDQSSIDSFNEGIAELIGLDNSIRGYKPHSFIFANKRCCDQKWIKFEKWMPINAKPRTEEMRTRRRERERERIH
jgi:hypothetical protein